MIEMIKYLMCVLGGVGIGYFLAHDKLVKERFDGYNEGFEEAKDLYSGPGSCKRCNEHDARMAEMTDEEFLNSPEVLEAAVKATEAFEKYQGISVEPSVLAQEITRSVAANPEPVVDVKVDVEQEEAEKIPEPAVPAQPVNYNRVSTPEAPVEEVVVVPASQAEIIQPEEFVEDKFGLIQYHITYFAEDDTLAGEQDQVIELESRKVTLGEEALAILKAGPDVIGGDALYVRNQTEGVELEIVWKPGSHASYVGS